MSPAELFAVFESSDLAASRSNGRAFVRALATGRFPVDELDKFIAQQASAVDDLVSDPTLNLGDLDAESQVELASQLDEEQHKGRFRFSPSWMHAQRWPRLITQPAS
jgi:hypothetical protein